MTAPEPRSWDDEQRRHVEALLHIARLALARIEIAADDGNADRCSHLAREALLATEEWIVS